MALESMSCQQGDDSGSAAALNASPAINNFVLYAEHTIRIGREAAVFGGDVGVARLATADIKVQLEVEEHSFVESKHNLIAPSVKLERFASVGDVQTDALTNQGARVHNTAPFPASMPPLPQAAAPGPAGSDVVVGRHKRLSLAPGNYGALKDFGTVILGAGTYSFISVTLDEHAELLATGGLADVRVAGTLAAERDARLGPVSGHGSGSLKIGVAGRDGAHHAAAAALGDESSFQGLLAVPHGTLRLGDHVRATGALAAFDISVGDHDKIAFQTGFTATPGAQPITTYVPPPPSPVTGPMPADTRVFLDVSLPLRNLAALQAFIADASNPSSPNYRKYLSAADFKAGYSPSDADYVALAAWAQGRGLNVVTYPNNLGADVIGTAAQIEQAFHANLILATRPDGTQFYELDGPPSIDLGVTVQGVSGLDDYFVARPVAGTAPIAGTYQSSDLRSAYLGGAAGACAAADGTGQKVGLFCLNDGFTPGDITTYEANTGMTGVPAVTVQTADDPNGLSPTTAPPIPASGRGGTIEISADIEMAVAMAPGAQAVVFEGRNADSILKLMSNNTDVHQFSTSFIFGPSASTQGYLTAMAGLGQSFFVGSGDSGAYQPPTMACMATGFEGPPPDIRSLQYVTTVGGTDLQTDATQQYAGENAWAGGGGGVLTGVPIPSYQVGVNAGNAEVSTTNRNVPDVAMIASSVYMVGTNCSNVSVFKVVGACANNSNPCNTFVNACATANLTPGAALNVSGTSLSGPLWAGFTALVNQQRSANEGPLGFANPTLYAIGANATKYANSFNDVGAAAASTNPNACGFALTAKPGYDLTTGLGTPKCGLISTINNTGRVFNIVGALTDLADFDFAGDEHIGPLPIEYHLAVNPGTPNVSTPSFEACVDDDVKVRLVFSASLQADLQTLRVCSQQGIREISSPGPSVCDKDVAISTPFCFDLPPGTQGTFNDGGVLCADDCNSDNHAQYTVTVSNTDT